MLRDCPRLETAGNIPRSMRFTKKEVHLLEKLPDRSMTLLEFGSVLKPFTAIMLVMVIEQGMLADKEKGIRQWGTGPFLLSCRSKRLRQVSC